MNITKAEAINKKAVSPALIASMLSSSFFNIFMGRGNLTPWLPNP